MSTTTTNVVLVKPDGSENVSRTDHLNDNLDLIDALFAQTGQGTSTVRLAHLRDLAVTPSYTGSDAKATLDLQPTWNTTGIMQGLRIAVTHTAASTSSRAIEVKRGSTVVFDVNISAATVNDGLSVVAGNGAVTLAGIGASSNVSISISPKGSGSIILGGNSGVTVGGSVSLTGFNQMYLGIGDHTVPGYSFSTDPDTGMYNQGTNALGFSAGAAEAMRLTASPGNDETVMRLLVDRGGVESVSLVTLGATDSGGVGFRALVVEN